MESMERGQQIKTVKSSLIGQLKVQRQFGPLYKRVPTVLSALCASSWQSASLQYIPIGIYWFPPPLFFLSRARVCVSFRENGD